VFRALRAAVGRAVQDPEFKGAMDKAQLPPAYQDADEFKGWWDRDATTLAAVIKKIGRQDPK
jgi:tripartite-type tricarboxylate transporter receptor subunit TctC